jgi:hypothetical protein
MTHANDVCRKLHTTTKRRIEAKDRIFSFSSYQTWLENKDKCEVDEPEDLIKRRSSTGPPKNNKKRRPAKKEGMGIREDELEYP